MNEFNAHPTLQEEPSKAKGIAFGIVGFVMSIFALCMSFLTLLAAIDGAIFVPMFMAAFAVVALVFCGIAKKEGNKSKIVVLGKIFGFISAGICGVSFVISIYTMMVYYLV